MIHLYRSNRAEQLAAMLARVVDQPLADPFARECIVVQRRGMERWLEMQLADRHGICAGVDFWFPRRFLRERLIAPLLGVGADEPDPLDPDRLTWEIAALLPERVGSEGFEDAARYLAAEPGARRRIALARRIAQVFDDYAIYRPELVRGWERGAEALDWQAQLWRSLVARCGPLHGAELLSRVRERLGDPDPGPLPERLCVFGLSALPPLFTGVFAALARVCEVHFFLLSPARERAGRAHGLAALGMPTAELEQALESLGARVEAEAFEVPPGRGLLQRLQASLSGAASTTAPLDPRDGSLSLHVCHGPMREAEVVRDQVLAAFDADPTLGPHDVAILTPDVETYAPRLEAVFAGQAGGELRVSVADRVPQAADALAGTLDALIAFARGRATSSEGMDLLARDAVRERFAIASADLETLRGWVERAGIRWGIDARHRSEEGQPALAQNTWRRGLERLWLGWAAGDLGRVGDVIGESCAAAAPAELLGRFAEYCETLFEVRERLREQRTPEQWSTALGEVLDRLTRARDAEGAEQQRRLRGALGRVADCARAAGFDEPIPIDAFWPEVLRSLGDAAHAPTHAFLSGAITIAGLVPMRAIPFRVIAVLGLADEVFPRRETRADFDRLAAARVPGDRSRRDEDRQLFLDVLLSARDRLILAYPGRSPRDGSPIPPSVLVEELLDALGLDREHFPVRHPLHPFSAAYFSGEDSRLFSYDERARAARAQARGERLHPRAFVAGELPAEAGSQDEIGIEELERFLRHPIRWFCQRRLGLYLDEDDGPLEEREPLRLDSLEKWRLGSELLGARLAGRDPEAELERASLRGDLPPGSLGAWTAAHVLQLAEQRWRDVLDARRAVAHGVLEVDREIAGVRIRGRIEGLDSDGTLVAIQYGSLERAREVQVWVRHVLANACRGPTATWLFGKGDPSRVRFAPVSDAEGILEEWIGWMERSLRRPIPLFPGAARSYAESVGKKGREAALKSARTEFESKEQGDKPAGESFDPYIERVMRGSDALDAEFEQYALRLFAPLLGHREEMS